MRSFVVVCISLALFAACGGTKSTVSCSGVVLTPGGPRPKACVHEIPNGATVTTAADGSSTVTLNGKVVASYPPCPCTDPGACTDRNGATHASGLPWMDGCMSCQCDALGDGSVGPVCTHNACPPDAGDSGDARDSGDTADAT
ncbi:MAG TPA: hypothetical protein VH560_13795, partial [Polyangia bacterium]|nr:hypothetical protein [Polyangia bacterium]